MEVAKVKVFSNIIELGVCYILSFITTYLCLLMFEGRCFVVTIYLVCMVLSTILFVLLSLNRKRKIEELPNVEAKVTANKEWVNGSVVTIYEMYFNNKKYEISEITNQYKREGEKVYFYVDETAGSVYHDKSVTLFSKKSLAIISIVAVIIFILALVINNNLALRKLYWYKNSVLEIFGYVFLFKFINIFLFAGVYLMYLALKMNVKKYTKIKGTVVDYLSTTFWHESEIGGPTPYSVQVPKMEYIWRGKKREYLSNTSGGVVPKIGDEIVLYADENGDIVVKKGDKIFTFLFGLIFVAMYVLVGWSYFGEIIQEILTLI